MFIDYLDKGRSINRDYFIALIGRFKDAITEKPRLKIESSFSPGQCTTAQISKNDGPNPWIDLRYLKEFFVK